MKDDMKENKILIAVPKKSEIPLPVRPEDRERVDEKYRWRDGYSDLERKTGTDWGSSE